MDKKDFRKKIKHSLSKMSNEDYKRSSLTIANKLLQEPSILEGDTIAVTISNKPEVDTIYIIEELWKLGKKVVVPKCDSKTRTMNFYSIRNFNQLEIVYMDLREPIPKITELVGNPAQIDVIIVPGIVFDKSGFRIGYGGGYYDRYLENYSGTLISLAFDVQVVDSVPKEPHDLPVHILLTETNKFDCKYNRGEFSI